MLFKLEIKASISLLEIDLMLLAPRVKINHKRGRIRPLRANPKPAEGGGGARRVDAGGGSARADTGSGRPVKAARAGGTGEEDGAAVSGCQPSAIYTARRAPLVSFVFYLPLPHPGSP